jgi:hypothetical protein
MMTDTFRPTAECQQMNAIYDALEALRPNGQQLLDMFAEVRLEAAAGKTEEDRRLASLFLYQLWEHVSRRYNMRRIEEQEEKS